MTHGNPYVSKNAPEEGGEEGGSRDSLEEAGDVLAAAARPVWRRGAVQELWRHDERSFPDWLTVIPVAIMLNPKAVA